MARLPDITRADLPEADRDLLKRDIALHRCLANSPGASRAFSGLGQYIRHGAKVNPRLRELAILQVGWLARSPYEWSHHVKIGMEFGVTEADIRALMAGGAGLDPLTALVLQGAREVYAGPGMSAATFDALRPHLANDALLDLVMTAAFYCAVVRVLASLEIEVEPEYRTYLERFPLPA